jgi:hypothetical protein
VQAPLGLGGVAKQGVCVPNVAQNERTKTYTRVANVGFAGRATTTDSSSFCSVTTAGPAGTCTTANGADTVVCVGTKRIDVHAHGPQQNLESGFRVTVRREKLTAPRKQLTVHGGNAWLRRDCRNRLQRCSVQRERGVHIAASVAARGFGHCAHHVLDAVCRPATHAVRQACGKNQKPKKVRVSRAVPTAPRTSCTLLQITREQNATNKQRVHVEGDGTSSLTVRSPFEHESPFQEHRAGDQAREGTML